MIKLAKKAVKNQAVCQRLVKYVLHVIYLLFKQLTRKSRGMAVGGTLSKISEKMEGNSKPPLWETAFKRDTFGSEPADSLTDDGIDSLLEELLSKAI